MATGEEKATFSLNLESNSAEVAEKDAQALEKLRDTIKSSQERLKEFSDANRLLKGKTEEVTKARDELKKKIEAEKDAISRNQLALLKQGTTYDKLKEKLKKANTEQGSFKKTLASASSPFSKMTEKLKGLKELAQNSEGKFSLLRLSMVGAAAGAVALTVAVAAAAAALAAGAVALAKWIFESGNVLRTQQLTREAMLGSALQAKNLGTQIDALAGKVSASREELNGFANELSLTRLSGQAIVDTLNSMGQVKSVGLDALSGKLKEITTRGQLWGRMQINPLEMLGSGLEFEEIAQALGAGMKGGVKAARAALFEGRVKIEEGAQAIRKAVEKKFGDINLRKMLDLNVMAQKFKERMQSLVSDVKLEPMLKALGSMSEILDESSVTGAALKDMITDFGNAAAKGIEKAVPIFKKFIQGLIIGGLELEILYLRVRNSLKKTFGDSDILKGIDTLQLAVTAGKWAVYGLAAGVTALGAAVGLAGAIFLGLPAAGLALLTGGAYAMGKAWSWLKGHIVNIAEGLKDWDWGDIAKGMIDGFINGIKNSIKRVGASITELTDEIKQKFSFGLRMHSPSKVFEDYGKFTTQGYAQGIEKGQGEARGAVADMVQKPTASSSEGRGRGNVQVTVHLAIGGGNSSDMAKQIASPEVRTAVIELFEGVFQSAGVTA